jgi:hypothetical protein
MKRTSIVLVAAASAAAFLMPSSASARSTYCSKSGDVCYQAKGSPIKLRITTAAKYFTRYRLCINNPHGVRECHRFHMHKAAAGTYSSTVSWPKHYTYGGKGKYHASWYAHGNKLGPSVAF